MQKSFHVSYFKFVWLLSGPLHCSVGLWPAAAPHRPFRSYEEMMWLFKVAKIEAKTFPQLKRSVKNDENWNEWSHNSGFWSHFTYNCIPRKMTKVSCILMNHHNASMVRLGQNSNQPAEILSTPSVIGISTMGFNQQMSPMRPVGEERKQAERNLNDLFNFYCL